MRIATASLETFSEIPIKQLIQWTLVNNPKRILLNTFAQCTLSRLSTHAFIKASNILEQHACASVSVKANCGRSVATFDGNAFLKSLQWYIPKSYKRRDGRDRGPTRRGEGCVTC